MQKNLPKDCGYLAFSFSYEEENGNTVYEYFESEDDCKAAEAVVFKDKSIYINYRRAKKEKELLRRHAYRE
jgi:hypothetical protein